ncbi:hypothetical protein HanHA300_Chr08g0262811 [Helianthus annuus]|nr:hypothetical protein HanHA300_Chr08g0262811 [Helianthus annuus]KAJ0717663.1 hypothetical protein HanLR1_Chr08g0261761 [Helianthus annuus]
MFSFSKSDRAFGVSLLLSFIRRVPSKLSHTFFSICITSKLCFSCREDQYSRSKNMLLLDQFNSKSDRVILLPPKSGCLPGRRLIKRPS